MNGGIQRCGGSHTWQLHTAWFDTANLRWVEEECMACGLLRRKREG